MARFNDHTMYRADPRFQVPDSRRARLLGDGREEMLPPTDVPYPAAFDDWHNSGGPHPRPHERQGEDLYRDLMPSSAPPFFYYDPGRTDSVNRLFAFSRHLGMIPYVPRR